MQHYNFNHILFDLKALHRRCNYHIDVDFNATGLKLLQVKTLHMPIFGEILVDWAQKHFARPVTNWR